MYHDSVLLNLILRFKDILSLQEMLNEEVLHNYLISYEQIHLTLQSSLPNIVKQN